MDVLIVEPLDPEVQQWLAARHPTRLAPELERDPRALRQALANVRALIAPPSVALDAQVLQGAPLLRAVGRISGGSELLDAEALARAGVEVVRAGAESAPAEAEFAVGAMLQLLRRVPVRADDGALVGRELGGCTVGLIGLPASARPLAQLLHAFGARVLGYDPALHASDELWAAWQVEPSSLRELVRGSDVLCVLLGYFSRYRGLIGERYLAECKPDQVLVSLGHSGLFDEAALADALDSGRLLAAWFDGLQPGLRDAGGPLHGVRNLHVTQRLASTTLQSRVRSAWSVARRIDEILSIGPLRAEFRATTEDDSLDLATGRASA
ncbi:MAG: phosphoglycerate dehydrogenase [Burkholderiales bacterium]|nr:phosphoglycerate dehydrogenase [Burkholderiales bacterium]